LEEDGEEEEVKGNLDEPATARMERPDAVKDPRCRGSVPIV